MAAIVDHHLQRTSDEPGAKQREVRLGLVLYGGASLAIYINGVVHEFARVVRGEGAYRWVKALSDSDVIVDVISGTSAGGINGLALAYALCNNRDFGALATLWRERADISRLLRPPYRDVPPVPSLLDSEGYYQPRLEEAFEALGRASRETDPGDDPSDFNELDLFVTGTDLDGNHVLQFDDAGHPIDLKQHLTIFWLKHRAGRKEPFNPAFADGNLAPADRARTTHRALATLARITSSVPGVFSPVYVDRATPGNESVAAKLHLWGWLPEQRDLNFVDGGVLNNHPFTVTIKAIFSRNADRPVDRKLFYVEPQPSEAGPFAPATPTNALQTVIASVVRIPAYQGIADDLNLLAEHNSRLAQYNRLVADLQDPLRQTPAAQPAPPSSLGAGEQPVESDALYRRSRLVEISDRVVQGIFKGDPEDMTDAASRQAAQLLINFFDGWVNQQATETVDAILVNFDIYYRLRRVQHLVYRIYDALYDKNASLERDKHERYLRLLQTMNRQIELYEIVQAAIETVIDDAPTPWRTLSPTNVENVWVLTRDRLTRLLAGDQNVRRALLETYDAAAASGDRSNDSGQLDKLHEALKTVSAQIVNGVKTADETSADQGKGSLLSLIDEAERKLVESIIPESDDIIRLNYDRFAMIDSQLFPLELIGGLHEKDIIETIRISPRDAQRGFSRQELSAKVAGEVVRHFGAFFKRSWRANDILWGRLDGACQLLDALLVQERVACIVDNADWRERIRGRFFRDGHGDEANPVWNDALDPAKLFPHAGAATQGELRRWLVQVLSPDDDARKRALDQFPAMMDLLIEATQLEIIHDELPTVIGDAIAEQATWNRFQIATGASATKSDGRLQPAAASAAAGPGKSMTTLPGPLPWVFASTGARWLDPFVAMVASAERARRAIDAFSVGNEMVARPTETGLGQFFMNSYRVGSEQLLRDVPTPVLLEMFAVAILVVRNIILGLFGESASRIKRNPLYIFGVSLPLTVFHRWVVLLRRSPGPALAVFIGVSVISVLALFVGLGFRDEIIWSNGQIHLKWLFLFIVAPLLILALQIWFLMSNYAAFETPWRRR